MIWETLIGVVLPALAVIAAALIGWVARGSVEHRRAIERERRRRAVLDARETVRRPGSTPARVSRARIDRGREMHPEE